ncbi:hypothetical protein AVEN_247874-1 [Araneus ventricosus]|uniref:Uncharacterized protein n=1 Tax=Araneus ventricosus TaxID=182803 RepID=A0A4Y2DIJ6_ARAVE|nr:hypothetical protein AVEN_247874-1 [Araneus ventricosus]
MHLAMLTDKRCPLARRYIRTLVAQRTVKAREIGPDSNCARRFVIPAVNFRATDSADLIYWQAHNVTPPTVLRHISCHELLKIIQDDVPMDGWDFIKFSSHTQAVERIVKLVTEASRKRVGPQNRDGFITATLESIKQMSQFESKKDYKNSAFTTDRKQLAKCDICCTCRFVRYAAKCGANYRSNGRQLKRMSVILLT